MLYREIFAFCRENHKKHICLTNICVEFNAQSNGSLVIRLGAQGTMGHFPAGQDKFLYACE